MSNLVDKAIELQVMTCLDSLLDRANHDEYLGRIGKKEALRFLEENSKYADIIKSALQRLQSIDNAEPSEALECLEKVNNYLSDVYDYKEIKEEVRKDIDTIKQALLKAQQPKHYLKWEDLEFKEESQEMFVLLNGSCYLLEYYTDSETEFVMIKATNTTMFACEGDYIDDIQFFNDLRLERVEE